MINCKHCEAQHYTVREVRDCAGLPPQQSQNRPPKGRVLTGNSERCPCKNDDCTISPMQRYDDATDSFSVDPDWFDHHIRPRRDHDRAVYHRPPAELADKIRDLKLDA